MYHADSTRYADGNVLFMVELCHLLTPNLTKTSTVDETAAASGIHSPLMMALGLVRQSDLPLSWLDPTSVFSCNGLYVPRETRNTLSRVNLRREYYSGILECNITRDDV